MMHEVRLAASGMPVCFCIVDADTLHKPQRGRQEGQYLAPCQLVHLQTEHAWPCMTQSPSITHMHEPEIIMTAHGSIIE